MAKRNYLNNKEFLAAIIAYKDKLREAEDQGKPKPLMPNYCGRCIELICTRMSKRPNFSGYSYRDEMVSDAILNCIAVFDNFDPTKSTNPFGYFSRIGWNAMIRRIWDERKETYIKHKNASDMGDFSDAGNGYTAHPDWVDSRAVKASDRIKSGAVSSDSGWGVSNDVIEAFEASLEKKKRKPTDTEGVDEPSAKN